MFNRRFRRSALKTSAAAIALLAFSAPGVSFAQTAKYSFDIPSQDVGSALIEYGRAARQQLVFDGTVLQDKQSARLVGEYSAQEGLYRLLEGTGLRAEFAGSGAVRIVSASDPQSGSAAGDGADGTVQALVVTAQKREENIQDVPIAMSAFTQEDLTRSQVAGGPDLMTQVPNFTFTKTNFSGYSIQIRGIGTQAISATTDAAVAVAFNNTPFIRNRFFEQEFYDLQRVEVLRGPQGTLYGRNATAGVVNIISAKPTFRYEAKIAADVANYNSTRLEGMLNIPLVEDKAALRIAGAWTKRDGFANNELTGNPIDGRDLWSTRVSLRVEPTDNIHANLIWEHFQEDDDRLRSGKQLCKTDNVTEVGGLTSQTSYDQNGQPIQIPVNNTTELLNKGQGGMLAAVSFSQGCLPESLYSPQSFQTTNGLSLPYYYPLSFLFLPTALLDPYASRTQSRDLRTIESTVDPQYRAKNDSVELQVSADIGRDLTLTSETAYGVDNLFSMEDFNRFNTAAGAWQQTTIREGVLTPGPNGGIFCDPQIGCSDRLVAVDLSTAKSRQFSQEFRLSSSYEGDFNFSLGANFLRYDTEDKYYVFVNSLGLISAISPYPSFDINSKLPPYVNGQTDNHECMTNGPQPGDPSQVYPVLQCTYIDPNPIGSLNDQGHNYFLSKNPYKLISYAVFGEAYYNLTDNLKVTGGLRWTVDKKEAPRIPSWLLASNTAGYPVQSVVRQSWSKPTGRLAIDWKPDLSFTDDTLLYASFAHGYKAGGANPPGYSYVFYAYKDVTLAGAQDSATRPTTFDPEYVNAFEVGAKNTLLDGRLTLNLSAFYYDYTGYQISEIVDRSAFNFNFDAKVWGAEIETEWRPMENLRLGFKGGFEKTRINDGMRAVDLMDRTAGHDDWVVVKPFPTFASNCIMPKWLFAGQIPDDAGGFKAVPIDLGGVTGGNPGPCELAYLEDHDPYTDAPYVDLTKPHDPITPGPLSEYEFGWLPDYPGWDPSTAPNHGEGFSKELGGKELPNAPHFTATVTADYTLPLANSWLATLHGDFYYQSEAWTRVFNMPGYDRLKAYTNVNLAAIFANEEAGWRVMAYVKNVFDRTSITGAFLNSDDTGLTTNVFLTEPRLYGLRVTKEWTGAPLFGLFGAGSGLHGPYPLTVEIGGQVQRMDAPNQPIRPGFVSKFSPVIDDLGAASNGDLDWGDGREVKLAYRPNGSLWTLAAAVRYGRANSGQRMRLEEQHDPVCAVVDPATCAFILSTDDNSPKYRATPNWSVDQGARRESHTFADFSIGHDVGLGGLASSAVSLGLRYGQFKSDVTSHMEGVPNWVIPPGFWELKYHVTHTRYDAAIDAHRQFQGAGPVVSWDASKTLLGEEEAGRFDLDWSVSGGVMFGKQVSSITGTETAFHYDLRGPLGVMNSTPVSVVPTPVNIHRAENVTVPMLGASLGLAYSVDRLKVGAGYRWERYFNAVDGGYADHRSEDRTIDGPYFKIAVGFGG